jgi:hypothetical protein
MKRWRTGAKPPQKICGLAERLAPAPSPAGSRRRVFLLVKLQVILAIALSCEAIGTLNHLNCGTVGTVMRGGGIGATLEAFPIPLGSVT